MKDEKKDLYAANILFREIGYYQKNKQLFTASLPAFKQAYQRTPDDVRLLLGFSWSKAKALQYDSALKDITKASNLYPDDLRVQQQKARTTYFSRFFEEALIENCRGIPKRTKPDVFISGSMQCAEVIERSIGPKVGHALRDHYDIIRKIAWKKALDARKPWQPKPRYKRKKKPKVEDDTPLVFKKRVKEAKNERDGIQSSMLSILESLTDARENRINIPYKEKSENQPPQSRTKNIDKLMAEKYLGKMCLQKEYIKNMIDDPRLYSPNYEGTVKLLKLAKHCNKQVEMCQEILRTRKPFYSIKYHEIETSGTRGRWRAHELQILQEITENYVLDLMGDLETAYKNKYTNKCIRIAYIIKAFADKKPLNLLPRKEEYLQTMYELIGTIYLDTYRFKDDNEEWRNKKRFNFLFGFTLSREPSDDSVYKYNKKQYTDVGKLKRAAEVRLKNSATPMEALWLYYELALLEFEMKHWDYCRFYALKTQQMADILKSCVWSVCAGLLIAKTHLQQRDRNEAKVELEKVKINSGRLHCNRILQFIDKSILLAETFDFDEIPCLPIIKERERDIIKTVESVQLQKDLEHIFQQMTNIPANRRLPIIPAVKLEDEVGPGKRKLKPDASLRPQPEIVTCEALNKNVDTYNIFY